MALALPVDRVRMHINNKIAAVWFAIMIEKLRH